MSILFLITVSAASHTDAAVFPKICSVPLAQKWDTLAYQSQFIRKRVPIVLLPDSGIARPPHRPIAAKRVVEHANIGMHIHVWKGFGRTARHV